MPDLPALRRWLNAHGLILAAGALATAVLIVILSHSFGRSARPPAPTHAFFMDEITGEVVIEPIEALPPLPNKDGAPTLARAVYYTLGTDDEKQLAYLEKYTEAGRAAAASRPTDPNIIGPPPAMLVRGPRSGDPWVPQNSEQGMKVTNVLNEQFGKPGFRIVVPK